MKRGGEKLEDVEREKERRESHELASSPFSSTFISATANPRRPSPRDDVDYEIPAREYYPPQSRASESGGCLHCAPSGDYGSSKGAKNVVV